MNPHNFSRAFARRDIDFFVLCCEEKLKKEKEPKARLVLEARLSKLFLFRENIWGKTE